MEKIELTQGRVAVVDDADVPELTKYRWTASEVQPGAWYATREVGGRTVYMHRQLLGEPQETVDHVNGDGLDNRRSNLRTASRSQQLQNRRGWGRSQYKGVSWHMASSRWRVQLKGKHVGTFDDEVEAGEAYDRAAQELFGEFALLNFPGKLGR